MISCENIQFNPFDLSGSSMENELGISYNCVSNMLKICVFSIYLFIFFCLSFISIAGLVREYGGNSYWNPSKRRFACSLIICMAYVALLPIFITGIFNRGQYILFPFTFWPMFYAAGGSINEWYKASKMFDKSGTNIAEETVHVLDHLYYAYQAFQIAGFFIWWTILPMIFFDNPWVLNWVFIVGYVHMAIVLILVTYYGYKMANVLLEAIRPHLKETVVDKKIVSFVEGLEGFLKRTKVMIALLSPMILLIIWVPLTQTPTNPGLDYFFYFEFFVTIPIRIFWIFIVNKVAWRDLHSIGTKSSSNGSGSRPDSSSGRKKSKDFSYTPEELNGNGVVELQEA